MTLRLVRAGWLLSALLLLVSNVGCEALFESGVDDESSESLSGAGVDQPCRRTEDCRDGLACEDNLCSFAGQTAQGEACVYTEQCTQGLYCDHTRTCTAAGSTEEGQACLTSADCERGLICSLSGLSATCQAAGETDIGEACMTSADCYAGLSCQGSDETKCRAPFAQPPGTPPAPPFPLWDGAECPADDTEATAYFAVPRSNDENPPDFYRLPFPNDLWLSDDGIDMSRHPAPGTVLNVPIIRRYLDALQDVKGFSTNPVVFFRFSESFDWDDVRGNILLVDITEGSPTYGQTINLHWLTTSGRLSKYLCPNWLAFAPGLGTTLRASTTYAAIVKRDVSTDDEAEFRRSTDLNTLLGTTAPGNSDLAAAHAKYAPLREWLADPDNADVETDEVLNATVFTTQDPEAVMPKLREVIRDDDMPSLSDVTVCANGVTSPCADDSDQRDCSPVNSAFTEIHGRISLPIFQHGTAPYEEPEQGGGFEFDSNGNPTIARHEEVCFALTIPKTTIPANGFPLMIFAHGTGGSFTNAVRNGLASDVVDGGTNAATLAIDLPQHGARRGSSTRGSDELFYNFLNPDAARDNVTQGSADLYTLVRWASEFTQASGATGGEIRFDASRIALFAHSQGATHASLMLPYEPDLTTVLLSGNGGHLTTSLLTKENPINIKAVLPFAMLDQDGDGELAGKEFHPMLAVFQTYFDRVDPINFAHRVRTSPSALAPAGRNLFMTFGLGDTYSTPATMQAYARAALMPHVTPILDDFNLPEVAPPLTANAPFDAVDRTIGMRQYDPSSGEDGHFVSTDEGAGRADVVRFMQQALSGMTPAIGD